MGVEHQNEHRSTTTLMRVDTGSVPTNKPRAQLTQRASFRITSMVDCFDRIAVQMTEIALAPILQLAERPVMAAATVRLPSNGRSILLTVAKRFPNGEDAAPVYAWTLEHGDATGQSAGVIAASLAIRPYPRPEDAFWGAVDTLRDTTLGRQNAG